MFKKKGECNYCGKKLEFANEFWKVTKNGDKWSFCSFECLRSWAIRY